MILFLLLSCVGVVDRVTDPDAVVRNYEWFHTAHERFDARTRQIAVTKDMLADETNDAERRRIRVELVGQQQSCRELAADYNANAEKVTVGAFRGWSLPRSLNPESCE